MAWLCLKPLALTHDLPRLAHPGQWRSLYSVGNSNLDVLGLTVAHALAALALTAAAARDPHPPRASRANFITAYLVCLALLGKAVAVAMLSDDAPQPAAGGRAGLAYLFTSIAAALAAVTLLAAATGRSIARFSKSGIERAQRDEDDAAEPLLRASTAGDGCAAAGDASHGSSTLSVRAQQAKPGADAADAASSATVCALLALAAADTHILVAAFSAGLVAALGQALIPYYTGKSIDAASVEREASWSAFHENIAHLVYTAIATAVFTAVRGGLFTIVTVRINRRIRERLFASLLRQEMGFFDSERTGDITSRLSADTSTVSDQISLNANVLVRSLMQGALVLVFMFAASWRLTVITFVLVPVNIQVCSWYGRYYKALVKGMQTALAEANVVAEEAIGSMATVRAHAAEAGMMAFYSAELLKYYHLTLRAALAYSLYMCINTFLPQAVAAIVLLYGGHLVFADKMSGGGLISFMLYQQSLAGALGIVGDVFSALTAAVGAADKVLVLIKRQPLDPPCGALTRPLLQGRVELVNVHFRYPSRPQVAVLRGVSLTIAPGEAVALVGPSGSGKSSVVKLLERFYLPTAGQVLLDGHSVSDYDPVWLKRHVALVGQEPVLYGRSILRNIMFGLEPEDGGGAPPSRDQVIAAAKLANAHDFIMDLPEGYDSQVGDRGSALSGGQKQRLAIARALLRDPAVLLLDEATSALDAESEAVVQEALDRVMVGRTVLVIAHRLSTVQGAARVVVLSRGAVAESGTQAELMSRNGLYAGLVRRQMRSPSMASMASAPSTSNLAARDD